MYEYDIFSQIFGLMRENRREKNINNLENFQIFPPCSGPPPPRVLCQKTFQNVICSEFDFLEDEFTTAENFSKYCYTNFYNSRR